MAADTWQKVSISSLNTSISVTLKIDMHPSKYRWFLLFCYLNNFILIFLHRYNIVCNCLFISKTTNIIEYAVRWSVKKWWTEKKSGQKWEQYSTSESVEQKRKEKKKKRKRAVDATQITGTPTCKPRPTHSLSSANNSAEIIYGCQMEPNGSSEKSQVWKECKNKK